MRKRTTNQIFIIIILVFLFNLLFLPLSEYENSGKDDIINPMNSANLEGAENIIITDILRIVNISGYGIVSIDDTFSIKNLNNNPITSILIAIRLNESDNLIFFESRGIDENSLLTERSHMKMGDYEMIAIYFDSPILPQQTKTISFLTKFKDLLTYHLEGLVPDQNQFINYKGLVYPIFPYKSEKNSNAIYFLPQGASNLDGGWGFEQPDLFFVRYDFQSIPSMVEGPYITPFLENLNENKDIYISFVQNDMTLMEIEELNREILISPWGIIQIDEELTIKNFGLKIMSSIMLNIPHDARGIYISDDIGEILGVSIIDSEYSRSKQVAINLLQNRVKMMPNSSFQFKIRYFLPFENYISLNWIQESFEIDIFSTDYEYLIKQQNTKIKIKGCYSVDSITDPPESIKKAQGSTILLYSSDIVFPLESRIIQVTFTIDIFDLLMRPVLFILLITVFVSIFVFLIKKREKEYDTQELKRDFIPINEIREFCILYEEKNALILEIRQSTEDAKKKKIAKKNYKNILSKNNSKIEEIQKEIIPFKKSLNEASETFVNIIRKLDVLDAERLSIRDSLNLLESRYKRGRLPSRAAYIKLSGDFKKRRKKIDRTIDKFLQQLRSYLL